MIQVNFNEAVNLIKFKGYDENGNLLAQTPGYKIASCNVRFPLSREMDYYTVLMSARGTMRINDWNCIKNLRDYGWFYFAFGQQEALDSTSWSGKLFLTPDIAEDIGFTTGFSILNTDELMPSWDETGFFTTSVLHQGIIRLAGTS
jgi:hypothetical protein